MKGTNTLRIPKTLLCLFSHDQQTNMWVGHCLDFDLVASAPTEDGAWEALKNVVKAQVETCFRDGFDQGLSRQAKPAELRAFIEQVFVGSTRSELIEFKLKRNRSVWMKGVEVDTMSSPIRAFA
jgi:hypothetical protein